MSFGNKTCTARSLKSFKGESVFILLFSKLQLKQVLEYKFKHMLLLWEIHSHACCIKNYYNCKVRYTLDNEKNQFLYAWFSFDIQHKAYIQENTTKAIVYTNCYFCFDNCSKCLYMKEDLTWFVEMTRDTEMFGFEKHV